MKNDASGTTREMKLHNGEPLWLDSARRTIRTRGLRTDISCEIAIIGGGISGAISALVLSAAGHDVVVLDRREPGRGSTLASTAMIQFELDTSLTELTEKIGTAKANRAYKRSFAAVARLKQLLDGHGIASGWRDRDALYLAGNTLGARALHAEADRRHRIGLPSEFLDKAALMQRFGIDRTGAIVSRGSAELDPARTAAGCLRAAQRHGCRVFSPAEIVETACDSRSISLTATDGSTITARKAIYATGYEVHKWLPRDAFEIISSWAIATKPIDVAFFWPGRALIWEASDPYLYLRTTSDNRILAGGEDAKLVSAARRATATPAKAVALLRKVKALFPAIPLEIDYAWGGAFADSPTGLPLITPVPGLPHALAILGCGGNGITFSMIAAEVAAAWAKGRRDPDADLFRRDTMA
jgi:glycine/D-amino acid oxidase-like deaminating enzyme